VTRSCWPCSGQGSLLTRPNAQANATDWIRPFSGIYLARFPRQNTFLASWAHEAGLAAWGVSSSVTPDRSSTTGLNSGHSTVLTPLFKLRYPQHAFLSLTARICSFTVASFDRSFRLSSMCSTSAGNAGGASSILPPRLTAVRALSSISSYHGVS